MVNFKRLGAILTRLHKFALSLKSIIFSILMRNLKIPKSGLISNTLLGISLQGFGPFKG